MTIAIDASTPARWTNAVLDGVNSTSAAFTAPSGAILVLCIGLDTGSNPANVTFTVADSGGLTWTERAHADKDHPTTNSNGGSCAIWTAVTSSSVSRTVSVQYSPNLTDNRDLSCKLYVVTGQDSSPIGSSGSNNTETGNAPTLSLFTSSAANSYGFLAIGDWAASGIPTSSDFTIDGFQHASFFTAASGFKDLGSSGAETASLDFPGTLATTLTWGAIEIKAAISAVVFGDRVLDRGLTVLNTECDKIYICSQRPTTFTEATSTYALGNKNWGTGNAFGTPAARGSGGRQIQSVAITDGSVTANGTVGHWAAVDSANSRLLATGLVSSGSSVTSGQTFTLSATTLGLPQ